MAPSMAPAFGVGTYGTGCEDEDDESCVADEPTQEVSGGEGRGGREGWRGEQRGG